MTDERTPTLVYLSGPMSGLSDRGVGAFDHARDVLRARGYSVLCPSECSVVQNAGEQRSRAFHLRRDAQLVMLCDEVCVLDGWENSKGAVWEVAIAIALGIPVWEFSTGHNIEAAVASHFDIRRSLIPIDFDEWANSGDQEVDPEGGDCEESHVPYRGASLAYCVLDHGHMPPHRDREGRQW